MPRFSPCVKALHACASHPAPSVPALLTQSSSLPPYWDPGWENKKRPKHLPLILQWLFIPTVILRSKKAKLSNYSKTVIFGRGAKWLIFHTLLATFAPHAICFLFPSPGKPPSLFPLPPSSESLQKTRGQDRPDAGAWPLSVPSQARCVREWGLVLVSMAIQPQSKRTPHIGFLQRYTEQ